MASQPRPQPAATCPGATGPSQQASPDIPTPGGGVDSQVTAAAITTTLQTYITGINSADYTAAYAWHHRGRSARGNDGRRLLWVDPARDLVLCSRWGETPRELICDVSDAIPLEANG